MKKMKKRVLSIITSIITSIFVIWTIIILFGAYTNSSNSFIIKLGRGYVFFVFFFLLYMALMAILNVRKLKWSEIRKRLCRFSFVFIICSLINIIFTYLMKGEVMILNQIAVPFGVAFGITFGNRLFVNKNI